MLSYTTVQADDIEKQQNDNISIKGITCVQWKLLLDTSHTLRWKQDYIKFMPHIREMTQVMYAVVVVLFFFF